jgi:hypothetical protein
MILGSVRTIPSFPLGFPKRLKELKSFSSFRLVSPVGTRADAGLDRDLNLKCRFKAELSCCLTCLKNQAASDRIAGRG